MKKTFNLRLPVLYAGALALGIIYSAILAYFGWSGILLIIPAVAAFSACALAAIIRRTVKMPLIFVAATVFYLVGAVYAFGKYFIFCQTEIPLGIPVEISGRVERTGVTDSGTVYLILSGVKAGGERVGGKLIAYLGEAAGDYCRSGYSVSFYAEASAQDFIEFGEISYNATRGVKYVSYVNGGLQARYLFNLFAEMNYAVQRVMYNNLDGETAGVCFAMLTGNTDGISSGTLSSFRNGGVAHVFAVSGLHIGVIYGALSYIFKKCRLNRYASTVIRIAVIALYSGICAFSPSSVRALVTCSVAAIASCSFRKYDGLNALGIAAIIILLVSPFYLFQVGFVLSFGCMLGIILIKPNLQKLLSFLPKKLSEPLAVGWSAQFASLPVQLTSFGYVSAAGLILNVIFIPVISALYIVLFSCTLICAVIPSAGVILPAACAPLQLVINLIVSCGFEKAIICGRFSHWLFVPFIAVTAAVTDKLNIKGFFRAATVIAVLFSVTLTAVLSSKSTSVTFSSGYRGGSVLVRTNGGTVLIVTDNYSARRSTVKSVDAVVVLADNDGFDVLNTLGCSYGSLYMRGGEENVPAYGNTQITYADSFEACGISFRYDDNALIAEVNGVTLSVIRGESGGEYAGGLADTDFELYCYGSDSGVLYCGNDGYGLAKCGEMRYDIKGWGYVGPNARPKE